MCADIKSLIFRLLYIFFLVCLQLQHMLDSLIYGQWLCNARKRKICINPHRKYKYLYMREEAFFRSFFFVWFWMPHKFYLNRNWSLSFLGSLVKNYHEEENYELEEKFSLSFDSQSRKNIKKLENTQIIVYFYLKTNKFPVICQVKMYSNAGALMCSPSAIELSE